MQMTNWKKDGVGRMALSIGAAVLGTGVTLLAPGVTAAQTVRVDITPAHAIRFDPDKALGSSMDILPTSLVDTVYSEPIVKESLSAGWGPITYRQNTELTIAAWHWNSNGAWSDAEHQSGYFTGSAEPKDFLRHSYGYPLPHRGDTRSDDSANKYSRLTDGDLTSYWKSNPYLTQKFTGEADLLHPQWIVIEFGTPQDIEAIRIDWANPYARKYAVQYWVGEDPMTKPTAGVWEMFPGGEMADGKGGTVNIRLASAPVRARYLRIWMTESEKLRWLCGERGCGGKFFEQRGVHRSRYSRGGTESDGDVCLIDGPVAHGRGHRRAARPDRIRLIFHQRDHESFAGDDSNVTAVRHAGRQRGGTYLFEEAGISDFVRGSRRRA
jgi:F5/8 type C domain